MELMSVSWLWDLDEQKVEEILCLLVFGVPEVKDGLDWTSKKNDKNRQKLHALQCATGCTSWICNACMCFGPLA